jgi:AcrR family transcriptional regulator
VTELTTQQESPQLGRPRRFDGDTERQLLMDAAIKVMTEINYLDVTVGDVLAEAGVSTRSFYRHFESKDALLVAVMRRDAESVGRMLDRAVASASDPRAGVAAWLDGYLACFYEPKRARRTTLYASLGAAASPAVIAEHAALQDILARSLIRALRAGHRAGVLNSPKPRDDATTVLALVAVSANQRGEERNRRTRQAARDHVTRFAWPALGLSLA